MRVMGVILFGEGKSPVKNRTILQKDEIFQV